MSKPELFLWTLIALAAAFGFGYELGMQWWQRRQFRSDRRAVKRWIKSDPHYRNRD